MIKTLILIVFVLSFAIASSAQRHPAYLIETVDLAPANTCGNIGVLETVNYTGTVVPRSFGNEVAIKGFDLKRSKGKSDYILVDWPFVSKGGNNTLPSDLRMVLGMGHKIKVTAYKCNNLRVLKSLEVL